MLGVVLFGMGVEFFRLLGGDAGLIRTFGTDIRRVALDIRTSAGFVRRFQVVGHLLRGKLCFSDYLQAVAVLLEKFGYLLVELYRILEHSGGLFE